MVGCCHGRRGRTPSLSAGHGGGDGERHPRISCGAAAGRRPAGRRPAERRRARRPQLSVPRHLAAASTESRGGERRQGGKSPAGVGGDRVKQNYPEPTPRWKAGEVHSNPSSSGPPLPLHLTLRVQSTFVGGVGGLQRVANGEEREEPRPTSWGPGTAPEVAALAAPQSSGAGSQRARTERAEKSKRPDNALPTRAPTATATGAAGGSGRRRLSCRVFPSKSHAAEAPPASQGRSWPGRCRARGKASHSAHLAAVRPGPRWPHPPGGRRCGGAGLAPGRVAEAGPERRGVPAERRGVAAAPARPPAAAHARREKRERLPIWRAEESWAADGSSLKWHRSVILESGVSFLSGFCSRNYTHLSELFLDPLRLPQREQVTDSKHRLIRAGRGQGLGQPALALPAPRRIPCPWPGSGGTHLPPPSGRAWRCYRG
ncbi:translation initiation factor IF-2-like [Motacilla alba alba]|uniref:translation initiation factor IF-2-like n=1 Tax=Motacilla alba alba TaxID=1094192 RepID=UPI0018D552D6|nr:translation initiation factor IF-2-like [Motacilla alba alba]